MLKRIKVLAMKLNRVKRIKENDKVEQQHKLL